METARTTSTKSPPQGVDDGSSAVSVPSSSPSPARDREPRHRSWGGALGVGRPTSTTVVGEREDSLAGSRSSVRRLKRHGDEVQQSFRAAPHTRVPSTSARPRGPTGSIPSATAVAQPLVPSPSRAGHNVQGSVDGGGHQLAVPPHHPSQSQPQSLFPLPPQSPSPSQQQQQQQQQAVGPQPQQAPPFSGATLARSRSGYGVTNISTVNIDVPQQGSIAPISPASGAGGMGGHAAGRQHAESLMSSSTHVLLSHASTGASANPLSRRSGGPRSRVSPGRHNVATYTVHLDDDSGGIEMQTAGVKLLQAIQIREKYKSMDKGQMESGAERLFPPIALHVDDGVFHFSGERTDIIPWETFYDDVTTLHGCLQNPQCVSACRYRLQVMEEKYNLYKLHNAEIEESVDRYRRGGGIFANITKVDNAVHLMSIMHSMWLVDYIVNSVEECGDEVVRHVGADEEPQTLRRTFEVLDLAEPKNLTAEGLGLAPRSEKRFSPMDLFDPELNSAGRAGAEVLRLFLTRDTDNGGRFFAEAVRPVLLRNDAREKYIQATESVIEVNGVADDEWERLAHWFTSNALDNYQNNNFIISLNAKRATRKPRDGLSGAGAGTAGAGTTGSGGGHHGLDDDGTAGDSTDAATSVGRGKRGVNFSTTAQNFSSLRPGHSVESMLDTPRTRGTVADRGAASENNDDGSPADEEKLGKQSTLDYYQQYLDNLFLPLFVATLAPEDPKNAELAMFLEHVGGFLLPAEEDARESDFNRRRRRPADVPWSEKVCDLYLAYYTWANITSLNAFRKRKGLNTFQFRVVAGDRGAQVDSLVYGYLLSDVVVQGLHLESQPVLQYCYGIHRIGITQSPLRNNRTSVRYLDNPFSTLFRRGLLVSLATDHPLLFHHSNEPLIEEFGMARTMYDLSSVDMCEIAHNSVMMSSFPEEVKAQWLGESYLQDGPRGNVFELSNVPTPRLELRQDNWNSEVQLLLKSALALQSATAEAQLLAKGRERRRSSLLSAGATAALSLVTSPAEPDGDPRRLYATSRIISAAMASLIGHAPSNQVGAVALPSAEAASGNKTIPFLVVDPNVLFPRLVITGPHERDQQHSVVAQMLHKAIELRAHYVRAWGIEDIGFVDRDFLLPQHIENAFRRNDTFDEEEWMYKTVEGVIVPHEVHQIPRMPKDMFRYGDFRAHVQELREMIDNILVRSFAMRRLNLLEHKFRLHLAVNHSLEAASTAEKVSQNRDFYQATKVDNNVRMETGMTARQLLNFIISKANNNGDDIVSQQKGKEPQTLRQLLQELGISPNSLTVDALNVQVDTALGVASEQYTPEGRDALMTLLLKTDNQMKGRYFAELTKLTFENFKRDRFTFAENRLPIYGASDKEWAWLSDWFDTHGMASFHNQWTIQIPRIYSYLRKQGKVANFAEYLENVFRPLWGVSLHPSREPRLFHFINHISGFDCVEDERRPDMPLSMATRVPQEWNSEEDPPYNYYMYYIWANINTLNEFRRRRNFSTFTFRPSCGETGPVDHLIGGFLLSNSINYGVKLANDSTLQYLFYLAQIGIAMCPLSNNTKVLDYLDNPFPQFFRRGLKVTLSTDSPLMFHHTQEPLLEEYSITSKVWKLSPNDMCEIARNSVLVSGFDSKFKQERLGELFFLSSSKSNDASRTHLSDIRLAYRFDTYHSEIAWLQHVSGLVFKKGMLTAEEEEALQTALEEKKKKEQNDAPRGKIIIDSTPDEAELEKLTQQRALMQRQLEELLATMSDLQQQNKQLTEKLADETTRDQQAQQLRRQLWDSKRRLAEKEREGDLLSDNYVNMASTMLQRMPYRGGADIGSISMEYMDCTTNSLLAAMAVATANDPSHPLLLHTASDDDDNDDDDGDHDGDAGGNENYSTNTKDCDGHHRRRRNHSHHQHRRDGDLWRGSDDEDNDGNGFPRGLGAAATRSGGDSDFHRNDAASEAADVRRSDRWSSRHMNGLAAPRGGSALDSTWQLRDRMGAAGRVSPGSLQWSVRSGSALGTSTSMYSESRAAVRGNGVVDATMQLLDAPEQFWTTAPVEAGRSLPLLPPPDAAGTSAAAAASSSRIGRLAAPLPTVSRTAIKRSHTADTEAPDDLGVTDSLTAFMKESDDRLGEITRHLGRQR